MQFEQIRKSTEEDMYYTDLQKRKGGEKWQKFTADSKNNIVKCFAIKVYDGLAVKCMASHNGEYPLYDDIFKFYPLKFE